MADMEVTSSIAISRNETTDYVTIVCPKIPNTYVKQQIEESTRLTKSASLDAGENNSSKKPSISRSGSFKRRSIRVRFYCTFFINQR